MNDAFLLGLIQNSSLLLATAFLFDVATRRWHTEQSSFWQALVGLALGAIGITVMLTPWTFGLGIVFDTRSVLLGISGLFFGFFPTAIALAMTAAFRFYQGGTGAWTGIAVILTSGAIGIAWHHFRRHSLTEISWQELYLFGMVVHLAMLGLMFTLPWATALRVLSNIALPVLMIYPVGTALLGVLMVNRLQHESMEAMLRENEERYRLSFNNVTDIIYTIDTNLNVSSVSPSVEMILGYRPQDFIGRPVSDLRNILTPESFQQAIADISLVLKGETIPATIYRFIAKDGTIKYGEISGSPVMREDKIVGIISVARDITDRKKAEEELQKTLESLRKAVGATIQVMVSAVEMRDPYTAGHQIRVAGLARAIAMEMGLPQDKIDGIRMAGSIHDIGKLSIPAEILSRPSKLTNLEFSLIKEHAQIGYEMLKDVESPWPLAQIVYQHHERMDGSGYPKNLKGDEIIMEARIMAVADVVEAMASHRPYRPTLGINAALEEITKNKGILYDNAVVDACLKLFREKSYRLT